jgi:hypothetical protein
MGFKTVQQQFAKSIRDPKQGQTLFPEIEARRLNIYQELFFNNVKGFVSSGFPVLKSLYSDTVWDALVRQFFIEHACHSPYFLDISEEFLTFLTKGYEPKESDPPFLLELAHYEWIELVISIRQANEDEQRVAPDAFVSTPLHLTSLAMVVSYAYPVHQLCAEFTSAEPSAARHYFVVYRDSEDNVQFVELNAITAVLLDTLRSNDGLMFDQLITQIAAQFSQFTPEQLHMGALQIVSQFVQLGVVVTKNTQ